MGRVTRALVTYEVGSGDIMDCKIYEQIQLHFICRDIFNETQIKLKC